MGRAGRLVVALALVLALLASPGSGQVVYKNVCNPNLMTDGEWDVKDWHWRSWKDGVRMVDGVAKIGCNIAVILKEGDLPTEVSFEGLEIYGYLKILPNVGRHIITTRYVLVQGKLEIGTPQEGMKNSYIEFALDNRDKGAYELKLSKRQHGHLEKDYGKNFKPDDPKPGDFFGDMAFIVYGGQVEFHGQPEEELDQNSALLYKTIPRLPQEERPNWITLDGIYKWKRGDEVVIASTSQDREDTDKRTIKRVRNQGGRTMLELDDIIRRPRIGLNRGVEVKDKTINMAAEVIRLSRRIVIRGGLRRMRGGHGGHFMIVHTALKQVIKGVRFYNMGQRTLMGRYPIHQHMGGPDADTLVRGCAFERTHQRAIVSHGTHRMKVYDNVMFNVTGHAILVGEDGWEMWNEVKRNVIITVNAIALEDVVGNGSDQLVSGIWLSNPNNIVERNRIIGSEHSGVWFEMRHFITGLSASIDAWRWLRPDTMAMNSFKNNVVHSNHEHGLRLYPDQWIPRGLKLNVIDGTLSFMNRGRGIFLKNGYKVQIVNSVLIDNYQGAIDFERQIHTYVTDSIIGGRTWLAKQLFNIPCSEFPAIEFHNRIRIDRLAAPLMENVVFAHFKQCAHKAPVVTVDGNDRLTRHEPFTSATELRNCEFLDVEPTQAYSFKPSRSNGFRFTRFLALRLTDAVHPDRKFQSAYLVPSTNFMKPRDVNCGQIPRGLVCRDVCFRTVGIVLDKVRPSATYRMEVVKSDGSWESVRSVSSKGGRMLEFWFTLQTTEYYIVRIRFNKRTRPDNMRIRMGDYDRPCSGNIRFAILQNGFRIKNPFKSRENSSRMGDGCGRATRNKVNWYRYCQNGKPLLSFQIPQNSLPWRQTTNRRELAMKITNGRSGCPRNRECQRWEPWPNMPSGNNGGGDGGGSGEYKPDYYPRGKKGKKGKKNNYITGLDGGFVDGNTTTTLSTNYADPNAVFVDLHSE